jgi:hypothetical protein
MLTENSTSRNYIAFYIAHMISLFEINQAWMGSVRNCISASDPAELDVDVLYKLMSEVIKTLKTAHLNWLCQLLHKTCCS